MPRIFDNMNQSLLPELKKTLVGANRADFCVGYINLRGWKTLEQEIEKFVGGEDFCCRLLVGMQKSPRDELQTLFSFSQNSNKMYREKSIELKQKYVQEFCHQLTMGIPNNQDEKTLRRLSQQLKSGKVIVKLFLRHTLHAKLYLIYRPELVPIIGFLGSSNLTFSGLSKQGELNIDVVEHDATQKLEEWFEERWTDNFCLDISQELAKVIDDSWAGDRLIPPYHIYLKMAYHLSQEALAGLSEYGLPREFGDRLFKFQEIAVRIAARHVNKRGGVLIGDVVGLGKTLIGTALARILQDDSFLETLIICPKNLVSMWKDYVAEYRLVAEVIPLSMVTQILPTLRRYRVVLIDESHNLRNRNGKKYQAIKNYIEINESKCILLSATPYNKDYLDLSAQLALFIPEDKSLGIRPEQLIREMGESNFRSRYQVNEHSLKAFEISEYTDDWRDLMKLFMLRRTRSFIKNTYAETDEKGRKYLLLSNGDKSYFPTRIVKTARFGTEITENDPYAALYSERVVTIINALHLPRYGLGNYQLDFPAEAPNEKEQIILDNLAQAGRRLMGFCRTNLFKRLESSGEAFLLSLDRHILRNYVYLYAINNNLAIPIGSQNANLLDSYNNDNDTDYFVNQDEDNNEEIEAIEKTDQLTQHNYYQRAEAIYQLYVNQYQNRFKWIRPNLFKPELATHLLEDVQALNQVLQVCPNWNAIEDQKLLTLIKLIKEDHPQEKILIFTQFADTAKYLAQEIEKVVPKTACITGETRNPTDLVYQFSPKSNHKNNIISVNLELRVLVSTDILSEGQNLQDCAIIVNYDLPWAIIRLIQRAGRIDRIGQDHDKIFCYSFLPAEGVENLINLRERLRQRLTENAEVVGTDEQFFEGDDTGIIRDLYNEKEGILNDLEDNEIDLTSEALQIWKNATDNNPELKKTIEQLANVNSSCRHHVATATQPEGALVYIRTSEGNDALAYIDRQGNSITQSQIAILRLAHCAPDTPAIARDPQHHELENIGTKLVTEEEKSSGGQLGRATSAKARCYHRLKNYVETQGSLFNQDLIETINELYEYPLRQSAIDILNRKLKNGINDQQLVELVLALRVDNRLCIISEEAQQQEPKIICSMGLYQG
ncbi:MAG: helicase-related protein [Snowella sp.]|nr:helicase-related protein [Snowella sp.]